MLLRLGKTFKMKEFIDKGVSLLVVKTRFLKHERYCLTTSDNLGF